MPQLRSLPEQPVMRDLYRTHPATCKPLGELTEDYARLLEGLAAVYDAAISHCRPGARLAELDRLVRQGIAEAEARATHDLGSFRKFAHEDED